MTTIICGTNRTNSETAKFAKQFYQFFQEKEAPVQLLELEKLPHDWFFPDMLVAATQSPSIGDVQDRYLLQADKFLFVSPEYNGSFPGVLKLFIDAISIREYANNFKDKKIALAGIASGKAGNLRGMDHLSQIVQHMGGILMPNRMPISSIKSLYQSDGSIETTTLQAMEKFVEQFIEF